MTTSKGSPRISRPVQFPIAFKGSRISPSRLRIHATSSFVDSPGNPVSMSIACCNNSGGSSTRFASPFLYSIGAPCQITAKSKPLFPGLRVFSISSAASRTSPRSARTTATASAVEDPIPLPIGTSELITSLPERLVFFSLHAATILSTYGSHCSLPSQRVSIRPRAASSSNVARTPKREGTAIPARPKSAPYSPERIILPGAKEVRLIFGISTLHETFAGRYFPAIIDLLRMGETAKVPACIGIILDGNRRWAKENGLPSFEGHRRGMNNVESIAYAARDLGIQHMAVYAFSTENWNRSKDEVSYLMEIFESTIRERMKKFAQENIAVRFVGETGRFSPSLQDAMRDVEAKNPEEPRLTVWVCISYGSKAEIVQAAQAVQEMNKPISEESLGAHLWTSGMPDPDLIIRTGGEQRLSNFLLWQSAYSELFFLKTHWPAFTKADLEAVLKEYAARERRMGK